MLPFIVIGAIAAVVLFVRPNPPIETIDLDDWSFELDGRVGTVKRRTGESSSSSSENDTSDEDSDDDDETCSKSDERAAQLLQRWWAQFLMKPTNFETSSCTKTNDTASSEESSYEMIDSYPEDDDGSDEEASKEESVEEEEKRPAESSCDEEEDNNACEEQEEDNDNACEEQEEDNASSSETDECVEEEKCPVSEEDDEVWSSYRGKGLRGLRREIEKGLTEEETRISSLVYEEVRRMSKRGMIELAWGALAGKGRCPCSLLDADFCPERVRVRWYAPYVWLTGEKDFTPSEIEWTRSLEKWVRRRKRG